MEIQVKMNPWRNFYESLGVTAEPDSVLGFGDVWGLASSPEHLIRAYWDCPWNFLPLTSSPFLDLWKIYLWHWQSSVQLRSCVQLFATPWTAASQASLSITNSWSLPKLRSIESVMPSNHLILCRPILLPLIFPSIRVFSNESALRISIGQSIGVSVLTSVPPKNTQDWSPLGWTGWISLQSKGLSRVFSNTTVQKHQFFGA